MNKGLKQAYKEHNREYDDRRLDFYAGAFAGGGVMLTLWILVAVLF